MLRGAMQPDNIRTYQLLGVAPMNDMIKTARFPTLISSTPASAEPAAGNAVQLRSDTGFHTTLAYVERAAEMINTLQRENEMANRQIATLREQLAREKGEKHNDSEKLEHLVRSWHRKVVAAENGQAEAKALAVAAVECCREMAAHEAELHKRLEHAEARAAAAENHLAGLQKAVEFELSGILL